MRKYKIMQYTEHIKNICPGSKQCDLPRRNKESQNTNTKPIKIGDNYAYDTILKRKFQYFAEGDLINLSEKEKDDDKFFCEYGDKWKSLFRSSIIIPIRCQILARHSEEYRMLGLICIDSKIVQPEWNRKKDSYAYHTTAFVEMYCTA